MSTTERRKLLQFGQLSIDIKALIVDHVVLPTDLRNLCLVNKQLHSLAIKPLYRNVSLDLGSSNDNRLSAFLHPNNEGLKYIRSLQINVARSRDRGHHKIQAAFATRMLLEFLPEDTLESFSCDGGWDSFEAFSADNLLLLYRKQRRLKMLEVVDMDRQILSELKKNPKLQESLFSHARELTLHPERRDTLDLCGYYVEQMKETLERLTVKIDIVFEIRSRSRSPSRTSMENRDLNDTATRPGLVTRSLFGHMMPFDSCTPFKNLKSLHLSRVSLRYCVDSWCKFVNFNLLQELKMIRCGGADALFGQLCKSAFLPRELKVLEIMHRDNDEGETLLALDGFLCLVSGIRKLSIDLEQVVSLPAAAGIIRHRKTLRQLFVHSSPESPSIPGVHGDNVVEERVWSTKDFEKICQACSSLEELSCAWPHTNVIRLPSPEWQSFEASTAHLRKLVTLHISTWPNNGTKNASHLLPRLLYEQLLQGLAQRAFELADGSHVSLVPPPLPPSFLNPNHTPVSGDSAASTEPDSSSGTTVSDATPLKLRLIAFGIANRIHQREESKNQIIFLRSIAQDAHGKSKVHATPIGWNLRRFIEPRSECLDLDFLKKDVRPPYREERVPPTWGVNDDDEIVILPGGVAPPPPGAILLPDFDDM
ncbi:Hypothetical protein R9X50_00316200 [Acrodontium crateriforme]|uniref:Uncharacterized protein n=1 Tax=Acrodontium crateriforme TaxID=150365 RepID=A0AAQ3M3H6_9PEZI|nr:Hypothetical protein R9X50_00316200 [Acrodontium crateriforme]